MKKKSNIQNKMAKEKMVNSLFKLMETESFDKISITQITENANVSRMAYYRNYESKAQIIMTYFDDLYDDFLEHACDKLIKDRKDIAKCYLRFFKEYRHIFMVLKKQKLTNLLKEKNEVYFKKLVSPHIVDFSVDNIDTDYIISYISGGMLNVALRWLETGMEDDLDTLSHMIDKLHK